MFTVHFFIIYFTFVYYLFHLLWPLPIKPIELKLKWRESWEREREREQAERAGDYIRYTVTTVPVLDSDSVIGSVTVTMTVT